MATKLRVLKGGGSVLQGVPRSVAAEPRIPESTHRLEELAERMSAAAGRHWRPERHATSEGDGSPSLVAVRGGHDDAS